MLTNIIRNRCGMKPQTQPHSQSLPIPTSDTDQFKIILKKTISPEAYATLESHWKEIGLDK